MADHTPADRSHPEPVAPSLTPSSPQKPRLRPFSHPATHLVAWIALVVLVTLAAIPGGESPAPVPEADSETRALEPIPMADDMNGRLLLGLNELQPGSNAGTILQQAAAMKSGTPEQRLAYVILVSEVDSPEAGVKALEALHQSFDDGTLEDVPQGYDQLLETVGGLLFSRAAGEVATPPSEAEQASLRTSLGVYGSYLLAHGTDDTASIETLQSQFLRAALGLIGVLIWFAVMGFSGFVLLILFVVFLSNGRLRLRFVPGTGTGSVYLETFALWLFTFIALSMILPYLLALITGEPLETMGQQEQLLIGMCTMFLSLVALVWPMIRGISFADIRAHIGLVPGVWYREVVAGVATYCAALPLLLVGAIFYAVLSLLWTLLFNETPQPSHPIQDTLASGVSGLLLIYLLACVAAPIVEEIMFRGVLYRYLRDQTSRMLWFLSFLVSALVSSFVFAIIHPQGVVFVPILGALAVGFCIGREWRGSLIAPIIAHALNNAVVMTLNVVLNG